MKQQVEAGRAAYRLWRSESRAGTIVAIVLLAIFFGWPLLQLRRATRSGGDW